MKIKPIFSLIEKYFSLINFINGKKIQENNEKVIFLKLFFMKQKKSKFDNIYPISDTYQSD